MLIQSIFEIRQHIGLSSVTRIGRHQQRTQDATEGNTAGNKPLDSEEIVGTTEPTSTFASDGPEAWLSAMMNDVLFYDHLEGLPGREMRA